MPVPKRSHKKKGGETKPVSKGGGGGGPGRELQQLALLSDLIELCAAAGVCDVKAFGFELSFWPADSFEPMPCPEPAPEPEPEPSEGGDAVDVSELPVEDNISPEERADIRRNAMMVESPADFEQEIIDELIKG